MNYKLHIGPWLIGMLFGVLLFSACSSHDDVDGTETPTVSDVISVHFTFSMPQRIIATKKDDTRMSASVVQEDQSPDGFRGLNDIHIFCFATYPNETSQSQGSVDHIVPANTHTQDELEYTDFSLAANMEVPVGTSYFTFYARANDTPTTHEQRMHYGCLEATGLSKWIYNSNAGIHFKPVSINDTPNAVKDSPIGQALLQLMNEIAAATVEDVAPNNRLSTATQQALKETYNLLRGFTTAATTNIEAALSMCYNALTKVNSSEQGYLLAQKIIQIITDNSASISGSPATVKLLDKYQGYPDDVLLPTGVARIVWNGGQFEFPNENDYRTLYGIPSPADYVYPANLQYHITSDLVAADTLVLFADRLLNNNSAGGSTNGNNPTTGGSTNGNNPNEAARYTSWSELINTAYRDAATSVQNTTRSVAMTKQVEYAVGKLSTRVRLENRYLYDAKGHVVDAVNGFTLKGYIIGGQREVDYAFNPVAGSHDYAIYDTDINGGPQHVKYPSWTSYNHILGLGTSPDETVYLTLELVNDGEAFYGKDGLVPHGCTFYLLANLNPKTGEHYASGSLDQIFLKDFGTQVNITITQGWADKNDDNVPDPDLDEHGDPKPLTGLATATYCIPIINIEQEPAELGASVDLNWQLGIVFPDIPL